MSHAKFLVSLKLFLTNEQGQILALEAQTNGLMAGFYDLPGGRIDEQEVGSSFAGIIQREIKEELGDIKYIIEQKPSVALTWMWSNNEPIVFIYFLAKHTSGEIKISDEHLSLKWVDLDHESIEEHFTSWHKAALMEYLKNE